MTGDPLLNLKATAPLASPVDSQLERLKKLAQNEGLPKEVRDAKIREAAREFEALLLQQMLKVMRESMVSEEGLFGGEGLQGGMYMDLFEVEVARQIAAAGSGLGIAEMVEKQLTERASPDDPDSSDQKDPRRHQPDGGQPRSEPAILPEHREPLAGRITSAYGIRTDPFTARKAFHRGIDLKAAEGTPVHPALEGTIMFAGQERGYGNMVAVRHADGTVTRYAHLKEINVKEGQFVAKETVLGTVGSTGRSTGAHLHFEVLSDGQTPIDPGKFLKTTA